MKARTEKINEDVLNEEYQKKWVSDLHHSHSIFSCLRPLYFIHRRLWRRHMFHSSLREWSLKRWTGDPSTVDNNLLLDVQIDPLIQSHFSLFHFIITDNLYTCPCISFYFVPHSTLYSTLPSIDIFDYRRLHPHVYIVMCVRASRSLNDVHCTSFIETFFLFFASFFVKKFERLSTCPAWSNEIYTWYRMIDIL